EDCQTLFKSTPEKYLEVPPPPKSPTAEMTKRGGELIAKAVAALGGSKLDQHSRSLRSSVHPIHSLSSTTDRTRCWTAHAEPSSKNSTTNSLFCYEQGRCRISK